MAQKKSRSSSGSSKKKNSKTYASAKKGSRTYTSARKGSSTRSGTGSSSKKNADRSQSSKQSAAAKQTRSNQKQNTSKTSSSKRSVTKTAKSGTGRKAVKYVIIAAVAAAVVIVASVYLKNAFYYKEHFLNGIVINGTNCSQMTASEAEQTIQNRLNEYSYTFTDHEGRSSTITAPELSVTYTDDGEVDKLLEEQEYLMWAFRDDDSISYNVTSGYTYDKDALDSWIWSLPCLNDWVASTDAYANEKEDGYWEIIPETYGDEINAEMLREYIEAAVDEGRPSSDISELECILTPSVYSDDPELTSFVETTNAEVERQYLIAEITEDITDVELLFSSYVDKIYLNKELLLGMLEDDEDGLPVISKKKITEWVCSWASDRGFDKETDLFVTHGGKLMNVGNGPFSGWLLDIDATADRVYDAVVNRQNGVLYPVTVDEYGNLQSEATYIEINIYKQTMWYYKEGEVLVETPVVTGDCTKDMDTPSNGVWAIYIKMTDYTMRGPVLYDGTYEYITHVDYWMPFNGQIGIHDMQSRKEFGGSIYKGNGSHGCVNTPYENAETIYNNAGVGTPVVVHS